MSMKVEIQDVTESVKKLLFPLMMETDIFSLLHIKKGCLPLNNAMIFQYDPFSLIIFTM